MYSIPQVLPPRPDLIAGPPRARAQHGSPPGSKESQGECQEQDHLEMDVNDIVYNPLALRISRKCIFFLCLSFVDLPTYIYL